MFHLNQFILATITHDGVKMPVSPQGYAINSLDSANWMSYDAAKAMAELSGYRVAFVLTEDDPYFLLDIDHCLQPDGETWTKRSIQLVSRFPDAMVEVSQSGKGLHVFGSYDKLIPHACKNTKENIELYSKSRFVILGSNQRGDPDSDETAAFHKLIRDFFPPPKAQKSDAGFEEWTAHPIDGWSGPQDDDELLELAFKLKGLGTVFRDAVTFRELFEADVKALAEAYPCKDGKRDYDASSADMALAQRLAYYTGKDCQRIHRLLERSALKRDKWYDRDDYLNRTIIRACARQTRVFSDPRYGDGGKGRTGEDRRFRRGWVDSEDIPKVFEGCVYIKDLHAVLTPGSYQPLPPATFNATFGGFVFAIDDQRTTRSAFEAFTQCPSWGPPEADNTCFRPYMAFGEIVQLGNRSYVNTARPIKIVSKPGDASLFLDLLSRNYTEHDQKILLSWMATVLQNPGKKLTWAPLLQGPEGNGKSLILETMRRALTRTYCHALNSSDLDGNAFKFTGWIEGKLLVTVEEVRVGRRNDVVQAMLTWISETEVEIQHKGQGQKMGDNFANFMFTSNYKDALALRRDQRRFAPIASVVQSSADIQAAGMDWRYWCEIYDWVNAENAYKGKTPGHAHIADYLLNYEVEEAYDPLRGARRAPRSTFYDDFFLACAGRAEQEILEAIEQGLPGFRNGWVSSTAVDSLLQSKRLADRTPHNQRHEILKQYGYTLHPHLKDGRASRTVVPDGTRPRLYVKPGSPGAHIIAPAKICDAYSAAQSPGLTSQGGNLSVVKA